MNTENDIRFWENAYLMALRTGFSNAQAKIRADQAVVDRKLLFGIK